MHGFWSATVVFYLKENTTFRRLDPGEMVRKHLYTDLSPTAGSFLRGTQADNGSVYGNQTSTYLNPSSGDSIRFGHWNAIFSVFEQETMARAQKPSNPNVQNDPGVASLNTNWQEIVTESFLTKFTSTIGFRAEERSANTSAWVCTYLLRSYESFQRQVWALAFVLRETEAMCFWMQCRPCVSLSIHPVLRHRISSAYTPDVYL
jgi:hypothetical protein